MCIRDSRNAASHIKLRVRVLSRLLIASVICSLFAVLLLQRLGYGNTTIDRLMYLSRTLNTNASITFRYRWYNLTTEKIPESLYIGHGLGSWPVYMGQGDSYPLVSNLVLEVGFELGLVGIVLLIMAFGLGVTQFLTKRDFRSEPMIILILTLSTFFFLVSINVHDLPGNRLLFTFLGLMIGVRSEYSIK